MLGMINGAVRGWILCGEQSLCEHVPSDKNDWRLRVQNKQSPQSLHSGVLFFFFVCFACIIYIAYCVVAALNDLRIERDVVILCNLSERFAKLIWKADSVRKIGSMPPSFNLKHNFFLSA